MIEELLAPELNPETRSLQELQAAYAQLDKWYAEEVKPLFDLQKRIRDIIISRTHMGSYWQDQDGIVFRTADKKGQWVDFTPHEIQRTRRPGEAKGTISIKDAEEAGFVVPKA